MDGRRRRVCVGAVGDDIVVETNAPLVVDGPLDVVRELYRLFC